MTGAATAATLLLLTGGAAPAPEPVTATVTIDLLFTGLRSAKGEILVCLWHDPAAFPDCKKGRDVRKFSLAAAPVNGQVALAIPGLAPGDYAATVIHDENSNRELDKGAFGMPAEGVGFSRNPRLLFGPPPYKSVRFTAAANVTQTIRMKYFL